jgi:glycosyltransferase involved in cell wall biosynthesis
LLLVDDGSTDSSTDVARQYASQYANIQYLEHPNNENRGMSASRNCGIHQAQGQYISFLDADDIWLPDHLRQHVMLLEAHSEAGMLYGNSRYWHPHHTGLDFLPQLGVVANQIYPPPMLLPLFISGKAAVPCTCSVMIRREVALTMGGFEESFQGMYEDQAFYAKVCLTTSVYVADTSLAWYRQHTDSHCIVTEMRGETAVARRKYLEWVLAYMTQHQLENEDTLLAGYRALWLLSSPVSARQIANKIRWGKKWFVRLEEMLLPRTLQRRLWNLKR